MMKNNEFPRRHIGPDKSNVKEMLEALNLESLDSLIDLAVPTNIREASEPLTLPEPLTEAEALAQLRKLQARMKFKLHLSDLGTMTISHQA